MGPDDSTDTVAGKFVVRMSPVDDIAGFVYRARSITQQAAAEPIHL